MELDIAKLAAKTPFEKDVQRAIVKHFKFITTLHDLDNAPARFGSQLKLNGVSKYKIVEELRKAALEPEAEAKTAATKKMEVKADG